MFILSKKRAILALTLVVCASSGFGLSASRFYSTHKVGTYIVYKQTNLKHCHSGCKRAPNVIKCTSRCKACLSKQVEGQGLEFAWSANIAVNTMEQLKTVCRVDALDGWK